MQEFLGSMGYDVWKSFVIGYTPSKRPPKSACKKKLKRKKKLAIYSIMEALSNVVKDKVGKCTSTKELWDKLESLYKVKEMIK